MRMWLNDEELSRDRGVLPTRRTYPTISATRIKQGLQTRPGRIRYRLGGISLLPSASLNLPSNHQRLTLLIIKD